METLQRARHPRTAAAAALLCSLAAGCAAVAPAPQPALEIVLQRAVAVPPQALAQCLREHADRPSYPRGAGPFATTAAPADGGLAVEHWFGRHRRVLWVTRFDLAPAAAGGSAVTVRLEQALAPAAAYARAAQELVDYCGRG